tara:strand:+ start:3819 stop:5582 length:1764 start_codon:yes stop_codon:yes gene_type:complete
MQDHVATALILMCSVSCVAVQSEPGGFNQVYGEADKALVQGDASRAVDLLEVATERWPNHPTLLYALACAHARSGDVQASVASLRTALSQGYSEGDLIRWDPDLELLRRSEKLEELLAEVELVDSYSTDLAVVFPQDLDPDMVLPKAVACTPDGSIAVVGYGGGGMEILDGQTGALLREISPFDAGILAMAVAPNGSRVTALCEDGRIGMWALPSGACISVEQVLPPAPTPADNFRSISPDAELPAKEHLRYFDFTQPWRSSMAFSPDGNHVVVRSAFQGVALLTAESAVVRTWIVGDLPGTSLVEWSPDGTVLTVAKDLLVQLVRPNDVDAEDDVIELDSVVRSLSFHPDGDLATGHQDGHVHVWDLASRSKVKSARILQEDLVDSIFIPIDSIPIVDICFSPSGRHLAVATGMEDHVLVMDSVAMRPSLAKWRVAHRSGIPNRLAWSGDGGLLWFGTLDRVALQAVDPLSGAGPLFASLYGSVPEPVVSAGSACGRFVSIVHQLEIAMLDAGTGRALWMRSGRFGGEQLVHTSGGHFGDSNVETGEWTIQEAWGSEPNAVDGLSSELFDPKRVRAAAAGVRLIRR